MSRWHPTLQYMPSSVNKRQRARLARAISDFWAGGSGPTHGEVTDVLDTFDANVETGSKRDRVSAAIKLADREDLIPLVEELLGLLRHDGAFDQSNPYAADKAKRQQLVESLNPYGITLLEDGETETDSWWFVDASTLPDAAAVRDHVRRLSLALNENDSALLLGSSKELLESTAKIVLARVDETPPAQYPALVTRALQVLMLHPKSTPEQREDVMVPVRKILGGVVQIAMEINELRGERGTGHGRTDAPVRLTTRHGRLAAGAALLVATLMFDTLDDESAPWCQETETSNRV
ncbi:MAG: abortive infection family protein [Acidimicrobiaceae bacterium]|nr:abortive infection family protein [Acidimicrobiaceae bacterium]MYG54091.1 abortive infection family protein [Acidimicrobiaceae bacterium]MYK00159.1 abortive infection family protein [Acidimicrobiaceae bacterium]